MQHPAYSQLRPVTDIVGVVLCPNPGYTTLEGTNSWVLSTPAGRSIVVDPGPQDEGHLNVLHRAAGDVALILLTHRHGDHTDGAQRFRQLTGAPIRAFNQQYCSSDGVALTDGERIEVDGVEVEVVATPGHTSDSVCFVVRKAGSEEIDGIITGDTMAGRHTTMLSETDGNLADYLDTLKILKQLGRNVRLLPGHGPDLPNLEEIADKYLDRRYQRLEQVEQAREKLGVSATVGEIVDEIYTDVDPVLRHAAEQSTRVAVAYLDEQRRG